MSLKLAVSYNIVIEKYWVDLCQLTQNVSWHTASIFYHIDASALLSLPRNTLLHVHHLMQFQYDRISQRERVNNNCIHVQKLFVKRVWVNLADILSHQIWRVKLAFNFQGILTFCHIICTELQFTKISKINVPWSIPLSGRRVHLFKNQVFFLQKCIRTVTTKMAQGPHQNILSCPYVG